MTDTELRASIEIRAYQIWGSEGRPHGRDVGHWLRAAAEIAGEGRPVGAVAESPAAPTVSADDRPARRRIRTRA